MAASPAEVIRPLRRVEYDELVRLGVFQDERVELIDGAIYQMSPIGRPHNFAVQELTELLVLALHGRAKVRPQMSYAASELSEPEPDLMVTPLRDWSRQQANEALLLIEVAESSLAYDRGRKLRLYATCAVPEYWIVNIPDACIEVHTQPEGSAYAKTEKFERGQKIRLSAFPEVEVRVSDVFVRPRE
ncbi:MAG: Uma2 family endonuclease [Polyangiaceae bacterium]